MTRRLDVQVFFNNRAHLDLREESQRWVDGEPKSIFHPVGASLLAMNARAPRFFWCPASSLASIASKLAPTKASPDRDKNKSETTERSSSNLFRFKEKQHDSGNLVRW